MAHYQTKDEKLTARELQVALMIAKGYNGVETGTKLGISPKTIATHREKILEKLNLCCNADITLWALKTKQIDGTIGFIFYHPRAADAPLKTPSESEG